MNYLLTAIALLIIEFLIATQFKDYHFIRAYFGDFLVVILLYFLFKAFYPFEAKRLAIGIFIFSIAVEIAQFFQIADRLQLTGIARIVVGTSFSVYDIAMYAAGCLAAYVLDHIWMRRWKTL